MSRSCHFDRQVPQFLCSHCRILGGQCKLVTRRNASTSPRGGLIFLLIFCVSVQDTGKYGRHIFTGPHPIPTRDERHSRENSNGCQCTSRRCRKAAAATPLLDCSAFGSYALPRLISRCTSIKARFGRVRLLTEWLILGDSTEAADYTKLWNDLRESISFVKGSLHKHF